MAMYRRDVKNNYCKRIEDLIEGRPKRSWSSGDSDFNTYDNNETDNDVNDNSNNNNNSSSSNIIGNISVKRWASKTTEIEGIRRYLEVNKISL